MKQNRDTLILIPIYTGHYKRLKNILKQLNKISDRSVLEQFYFICTGPDDFVALQKKVPIIADELYRSRFLSLSNIIDLPEVKLNASYMRSIINLKKIYGIEYLFNHRHAGHIVCLDSDVHFSPNFCYTEFTNSVNEIARERRIFGTRIKTDFYAKILSECSDFLNLSPMSVYSWYFSPPIYEKEKFLKFMLYVKKLYGRSLKDRINWFTFDHLLYSTFIKEFYDIEEICIELDVVPEKLTEQQRIQISRKYNTYCVWTKDSFSSRILSLFRRQPYQVRFHTDRVLTIHRDLVYSLKRTLLRLTKK